MNQTVWSLLSLVEIRFQVTINFYFSPVAEFLSEYDSISTKTRNCNCWIRWNIIKQQTPATIHVSISSWYWCQLEPNDFKHFNSIYRRCHEFWNFTIPGNRERRQNRPRWFHWSVDWTKTSFIKHLCHVSYFQIGHW